MNCKVTVLGIFTTQTKYCFKTLLSLIRVISFVTVLLNTTTLSPIFPGGGTQNTHQA